MSPQERRRDKREAAAFAAGLGGEPVGDAAAAVEQVGGGAHPPAQPVEARPQPGFQPGGVLAAAWPVMCKRSLTGSVAFPTRNPAVHFLAIRSNAVTLRYGYSS